MTPVIPSVSAAIVAALVPIIINALRNPREKAIEKQTKQLQYWKAMLDTSGLVDDKTLAAIKETSRQGVAEAVDKIQKLQSKFVGRITVILRFGAVMLMLTVIAAPTIQTMRVLERNDAPVSMVNNLAVLSFCVQLVVSVAVWFGTRNSFRDVVWSRFKPGGSLDFVLGNKRFEALFGLLAIFAVLGAIWALRKIA